MEIVESAGNEINYAAPQVEILHVEVESGFAGSNGSSTESWRPGDSI